MKYAILFVALFLITSCSKPETEESVDCIEVEYDQEFLVKIDETVCFPDGKTITIKVIEDQFCPCEAICVWQGELSVLSETEDENGEKDLFTFGTETLHINSNVFPQHEIKSFTYIYNGETDNLPVCSGEFNSENVELKIMVSEN